MIKSGYVVNCFALQTKCACLLEQIRLSGKNFSNKQAITKLARLNNQKPTGIKNPNEVAKPPLVNKPKNQPPTPEPLEPKLPSLIQTAVQAKVQELQKTMQQYRQTVNSPNVTSPQIWHNTQGNLRRLNEQMAALRNFAQKNNIVIPENK